MNSVKILGLVLIGAFTVGITSGSIVSAAAVTELVCPFFSLSTVPLVVSQNDRDKAVEKSLWKKALSFLSKKVVKK